MSRREGGRREGSPGTKTASLDCEDGGLRWSVPAMTLTTQVLGTVAQGKPEGLTEV